MTDAAAPDRLSLALAEFDAARELSKQVGRLEQTAPVDDDFPSVKFAYDGAVRTFLLAAKANGRVTP